MMKLKKNDHKQNKNAINKMRTRFERLKNHK